METNKDNSTMKSENKSNISRIIKIIVIAILFLLPLVYLFMKTSPKEKPIVNQPPKQDIASLENAVRINPSFDNLYNLGNAYVNNKMPGRGTDYLKKAIELNPKSAVAYNDLGVANIMLQQYQDGIDACNKAIELDNKFQLAKNNLKWGMDEKNKVLAAIETQEKIPANKRDIPFYVDHGLNYLKIGNYDKSIEVWNKILEKDKKNTQAINNIGTALMLKNQYDDAISMFQKAIDLEPKNQLAKNNLAWAQDEKNKAAAKK